MQCAAFRGKLRFIGHLQHRAAPRDALPFGKSAADVCDVGLSCRSFQIRCQRPSSGPGRAILMDISRRFMLVEYIFHNNLCAQPTQIARPRVGLTMAGARAGPVNRQGASQQTQLRLTPETRNTCRAGSSATSACPCGAKIHWAPWRG